MAEVKVSAESEIQERINVRKAQFERFGLTFSDQTYNISKTDANGAILFEITTNDLRLLAEITRDIERLGVALQTVKTTKNEFWKDKFNEI